MEKIKRKILVLPGSYHSPSARFRLLNLVDSFKELGFLVDVKIPYPDRNNRDSNNNLIWWAIRIPKLASVLRYITTIIHLRNAKRYDFIITNRDIVPELKIQNIELNLIKKGSKLIFDFDDAIHIGNRGKKLEMFFSKLHAIIPGNDYLANYAYQHNENVYIIPTVVDTNLYTPSKTRKAGKIRVGWSGSASTNVHCLPILQKSIENIAKSYEFEFIVISNENPFLNWKGVDVKFYKWESNTEIEYLQFIDIGLMPLKDDEFEKGKCGLKAIQYMGVGIPALVSPVGVNKKIVEHGINGFHCVSNEDWENYIIELFQDNELRIKMGENARLKVLDEYSVNKAKELWSAVLNK